MQSRNNGAMNAEKNSVEIDIQDGTFKAGDGKISSADEGCTAWAWSVWELSEEDSNRLKFSLKVGLAVLLVSVLVLVRAPYDVFGTNIVWCILTVAVMFEYTVGATFNRGFNRALGSLLAGILAVGAGQLALRAGRGFEPFLIGISIFLIGVITSFMKLWPPLAPYEHGLRVVLFTYCLIAVSGYRIGNPIETAMERLYSIAIGGIVTALVNVLVFPVWAGEQLHMELVNGFNTVADSLEECVNKYLEDEEIDYAELYKVATGEFPDEPAFKKCKATLSSSSTLEYLANSAQWEPPHDRFKSYFYPWSEYIKVGAVLRYCAYGVMALHGVLHSEIQAPHSLRITFGPEIREATSEATELVRSLAKDISNMRIGINNSLLKRRIHTSAERLETAINTHSYLLLAQPSHDSSKPTPRQNNKSEGTETETYHEMTRKQSRRLRSREEEETGASKTRTSQRIKGSETAAALSVATFITLHLEFLARLDPLVDAVDELSRSAFKQEETA